MPLFGHKNKQDRNTDRHHDDVGDQRRDGWNAAGAGSHQDTATQTGQGQYNNTGQTYPANAAGPGGVQGYDPGSQAGGPYTAHAGAGQPGQGGYAGNNAGQNVDPNQNFGRDSNLAPTNHFNDGQRGGAANRMTGKMESAVGSLVGSQALKAKGMQKDQEAQAFKSQSAEIAEAERLEKEALLRRERAVQHGAHPNNKILGGPQNQQTRNQGYGGQDDSAY